MKALTNTILGADMKRTHTTQGKYMEGVDQTKKKRMLKRVGIQKVPSRSMDTMLGRKTKSIDTEYMDHTKNGTMLGLKIMATETEGMDHTKQKRLLKISSRSMDT